PGDQSSAPASLSFQENATGASSDRFCARSVFTVNIAPQPIERDSGQCMKCVSSLTEAFAVVLHRKRGDGEPPASLKAHLYIVIQPDAESELTVYWLF